MRTQREKAAALTLLLKLFQLKNTVVNYLSPRIFFKLFDPKGFFFFLLQVCKFMYFILSAVQHHTPFQKKKKLLES